MKVTDSLFKQVVWFSTKQPAFPISYTVRPPKRASYSMGEETAETLQMGFHSPQILYTMDAPYNDIFDPPMIKFL